MKTCIGKLARLGMVMLPGSVPDVQVPAIQLTSDSGLLGDFSSLFDGVTGGTSGIGGLGDLTGDLTGLLGGLNPSSLVSDLPGLASVDPAPADPSLLTPYTDLFTNTFTNLQAIGSEFVGTTLPELQGLLQQIIADPSLIADLPQALFGVGSRVCNRRRWCHRSERHETAGAENRDPSDGVGTKPFQF